MIYSVQYTQYIVHSIMWVMWHRLHLHLSASVRNCDLDPRERIAFESAFHVLGSGCVLYTSGFAVNNSTVNQTA